MDSHLSKFVCVQLLSHVQFFATLWNVDFQVLLSMGFYRQEYWSGLPCLSPGDLSNPGIKSRSPALQADSLPSEPPGNPKNTGVGDLSLRQGIFPTQELNWGLLHCRQILFQLSYQGSPHASTLFFKIYILYHLFWPCSMACGILVPRLGIEPTPPAVKAQSFNHRTAMEVPLLSS